MRVCEEMVSNVSDFVRSQVSCSGLIILQDDGKEVSDFKTAGGGGSSSFGLSLEVSPEVSAGARTFR